MAKCCLEGKILKETISGIITVILTVLIHEWATDYFGFEYNMFSDELNLLSVCLDLGIWLAVFLAIYFVIKMVLKKRNKKCK